jgi:hypothetical protein
MTQAMLGRRRRRQLSFISLSSSWFGCSYCPFVPNGPPGSTYWFSATKSQYFDARWKTDRTPGDTVGAGRRLKGGAMSEWQRQRIATSVCPIGELRC